MKDISKITVKHFLNKNLPVSQGDKLLYPVYIKITFQRKSTEIKSTIHKLYADSLENYHLFNDLDFVYESFMIKHFVTKGYQELGDKFTLRGIASLCRNYNEKRIKDLFNGIVFNEFDDYLCTNRPKFWLMLGNRIPSVDSFTYFEAALKLLDNDPFIVKLKDKFEILRDIESVEFPGFGQLQEQRLPFWQFGTAKQMFVIEAQTLGYSQERIQKIISVIDFEIQKLSM